MSGHIISIIKGHVGIGDPVEGIALSAKDNFSARYDLDRIEGIFSRPSHALFEQSYVNRILVLDAAKGGVATAWMLYEMAARQMAPLALLLNSANPIMAQGAAFARVPLIDRFESDITEWVQTGERILVTPAEGMVEKLEEQP
jgi:predicted aconitase with swiveling domain